MPTDTGHGVVVYQHTISRISVFADILANLQGRRHETELGIPGAAERSTLLLSASARCGCLEVRNKP
jgi:hypothetical protein